MFEIREPAQRPNAIQPEAASPNRARSIRENRARGCTRRTPPSPRLSRSRAASCALSKAASKGHALFARGVDHKDFGELGELDCARGRAYFCLRIEIGNLPGLCLRVLAHNGGDRERAHVVHATSRGGEAHVGAYRFCVSQRLARARRVRRGEWDSPTSSAIDVYLLRGWLATLARTVAPASTARKIAAARAWMKWLFRQKTILTKNPAAEIASPKVRRPLPTFLSVDAAKEVVETPDLSNSGRQTRPRACSSFFMGPGCV